MNIGLQRALQRQLDRWQLFAPCPGTNATIIDSGFGSWSSASGYSDVDTLESMPAGALCYIYSITKTFTAIRVLQLVEQAMVSLDEPIARYLPGLPLPPTVTVRRLLNHTSGMPSYTDLPSYLPANLAQPSKPWSYDQVLELTCRGKLDFSPGDGWHYSNTGYMLLHRLIETITQQSFAHNIEQSIVRPLGLQHTYVVNEIDAGRLVPGYCPYLNDLQVMENIMRRYHPGWCLTGLIASTTREIAQLYVALFEGQLISANSLAEMTSWTSCGQGPHPFFSKPGYGLGLMIDPGWGFSGLYGHGGDGPGFNTWAMYLPDFHGRKLALVVFCNASMGAPPFQLSRNLLRTLE